MTGILEIQDLVLHSLASDEENKGLAQAFDEDFLNPSSEALIASLDQAGKTLKQEDVFRAAYLYQESIRDYETRGARDQQRETLRLFFLWHDSKKGAATKKDLRDYLAFLATRVEIRNFAKDSEKAIACIRYIYEEESIGLLEDLTGSTSSTITRWIRGANPTKSSRQTIASAAEVLYQLYEIKGWDKQATRIWFEKYARQLLIDNSTRPWDFFPHALVLRLQKLGLEAIGQKSWF